MKVSVRFLTMAAMMVALAAFAATTARAQFPLCNGTEITIKNLSDFPVVVCVKGQGCFRVPAHDGIQIPVDPPVEVPGIAGAANITHEWQKNPNPPPDLWIPSIQMNPTLLCFDVTYDESTCLILVTQAPGPPCLNP